MCHVSLIVALLAAFGEFKQSPLCLLRSRPRRRRSLYAFAAALSPHNLGRIKQCSPFKWLRVTFLGYLQAKPVLWTAAPGAPVTHDRTHLVWHPGFQVIYAYVQLRSISGKTS